MIYLASARLRHEVDRAVRAAESKNKIVNVTAIVDGIFAGDRMEALSYQEIEDLVLGAAVRMRFAIEFGRPADIPAGLEGYTRLEIELVRHPDD